MINNKIKLGFVISIITFILLMNIIKPETEQVCSSNYVLVELSFNQGQFNLISKTLETGCYSRVLESPTQKYNYQLTNNNSIIYSAGFNPELVFIDNQPITETQLQGGIIELSSGTLFLTIPDTNANNLEMYKQGNKIFETAVLGIGAESCRIK